MFMTTNHVEKLDLALIRPGRVDLMQLIDDATPEQALTLFNRFYGEGDGEILDREVRELAKMLNTIVWEEMKQGRVISMAALQGLFIRNSAKDAVSTCREYFVDRRTTC